VLLDIVEDPARWAALGDGYRVEAHIRVANLEGAVVSPAAALFRDQGSWHTFAVRAGKAHKIQLEAGARTPDWIEVKQGLSAGDKVVLYPSDQVADGVQLAPKSAARQ
jgi:HlyD family secretion protein